MTDLRKQTIDTYNTSAKELAEYFRGIGPREKYIEKAFQAAGNPLNARVVEIGCGDGRDAKVIAERAGWYEGSDVSSELIKLAKDYVPDASFVVADAVTYVFPEKINVIFAFASILHLDRKELATVLRNAYVALVPGGIFYISSKWAEAYKKDVKRDQYGARLFHFYNADIVEKLAEPSYMMVETWREVHGHTEWFELILQKPTGQL